MSYGAGVRSYGQYCGLARALDVVGDRWTMLLLRELAIRPCRYRDLRDGLPGIATNLLADRLRQLESDGIIERHEGSPPLGAGVYRLSPLGRRLIPVLLDLAAWGSSWMKTGYRSGIEQGDDVFRGRWLVFAVPALLHDAAAGTPDMRVRMDVGDEAVAFEISGGALVAPADPGGPVDLSITTSPETALALLTGQVSPAEASEGGLAEMVGEAWAMAALEALAAAALVRISVDGDAPGEAVAAYLGYSIPARPA